METTLGADSKVDLYTEKFREVQKKYSEFGTMDSEPEYQIRRIVRKALKGETPRIPYDVDGWELYPGGEEAASALCQAANYIVDAIHDTPLRNMQKVGDYLRGEFDIDED